MGTRRSRRRLASVALAVMIAAAYAHAAVTLSGKAILLNGQPFSIQGVDYSPVPVGRTAGAPGGDCVGYSGWWADRATYISDFPQIHQLGVNTLNTYGILNSGNSTTQVLQALDAAQASGLHVVMNYYVQTFYDLTDPVTQTRIHDEVLAAVNAYKAHPAVLMWSIGNEVNLNGGNGNAAWYSFLNTLAGDIKVADPNHLVTTVQGECPQCAPAIGYQIGSVQLGTTDSAMKNLDVWSVTSYRGKTFQDLFQTLTAATTKPVFVAEFGKDAYADAAQQEDAAMQASYITPQWQEIASNLSARGSGALIGGAVFEWSDEWWKVAGASCLAHDTAALFTRPDDLVDPKYNDEWFGITAVSPVDAITNPNGTNRALRLAYTALQAFWNPSAASAASGAATAFFIATVRNFPNPFIVGRDTRFVLLTSEAGSADFRIYDAAGQFVTSFDVPVPGAGRVEATWNGRNRQGALVSPGLYVVKIHGHSASHDETQFRRVVAVK